jgi:isopropylmalate/homocitrate/citramalate synthase
MSAAEKMIQVLFYAFEETFEKVQGVYLDKGTSLFETLAGISAEVASTPVGTSCATIAAHVEHMRFYIDILEQFIHSNPPKDVDWKHIWNTVSAVTPDEWAASIQRLRASYERVLKGLKARTEWDGNDDFGGAFAIVVHTAYHLGEIRQALCTVGGER